MNDTRNLAALKPALVWKHFAQIVRIPRPSSHEEKIRKYVMDFAREKGLECKEDAAHNVYVRKPASKGMEDRKGVVLQAHLDMVPQKNNDICADPLCPHAVSQFRRNAFCKITLSGRRVCQRRDRHGCQG